MRIPCHIPYQSFYSNQACYQFMIIPEGSNNNTVRVGTGLFKYESFTPGQQSPSPGMKLLATRAALRRHRSNN